jgi:hypothetical protein
LFVHPLLPTHVPPAVRQPGAYPGYAVGATLAAYSVKQGHD